MSNGLPPVPTSAGLQGHTSVTWYIREADVPGRNNARSHHSKNSVFTAEPINVDTLGSLFSTQFATFTTLQPHTLALHE